MKTLQQLLAARVGGDLRAANAVVDVRGDKVRIILGAVGDHPRIVLGIEGDKIKTILPAKSDGKAEKPKGDGGGSANEGAGGGQGDAGGAEGASGGTDAPEGEGSAQAAEKIDPNAYNKDDLIEIASKTPGAEIRPTDNKAAIAAAINKARGVE